MHKGAFNPDHIKKIGLKESGRRQLFDEMQRAAVARKWYWSASKKNAVFLGPTGSIALAEIQTRDVCDGSVNDSVNAPYNRSHKGEHDKKRKENRENQRDSLRKRAF
jgi:hypothetical protein